MSKKFEIRKSPLEIISDQALALDEYVKRGEKEGGPSTICNGTLL